MKKANWARLLITIMMLFSSQAISAANDAIQHYIVTVAPEAGMAISDSQRLAHQKPTAASIEAEFGISLLEEFRAETKWYLSIRAADRPSLQRYLDGLGVAALTIVESLFVNSPQLGGGPLAGDQPRVGHRIYVIERAIPGIGFAPLEKKIAVSKGSQSIIESLDGAIEWDHSFLTSEGTYCVYRAEDPAMLEKHASLAGIPANPITEVTHLKHNYDF